MEEVFRVGRLTMMYIYTHPMPYMHVARPNAGPPGESKTPAVGHNMDLKGPNSTIGGHHTTTYTLLMVTGRNPLMARALT